MKIKDFAEIKSGLILARKVAELPTEVVKTYDVLLASSIDEYGNISNLKKYESSEILGENYLTQKGNVCMKLSYPFRAVYIDEKSQGMVLSSFFCVINIKNNNILPQYLSVFLNSQFAQKQMSKNLIGSTVQTIRTSSIGEIDIPSHSLEEQLKICECEKLFSIENKLLNNLLSEKKKLHSAYLEKRIGAK